MVALRKSGKGKTFRVKDICIGDVVVMEDGTEAKVTVKENFTKPITVVQEGSVMQCTITAGPFKGATMSFAYLNDNQIMVSKKKEEPSAFSTWFKSLFSRSPAVALPKPTLSTANDNTVTAESLIKMG